MEPIRSIALGGLEAAARRLVASASNIANLRTGRPAEPDKPVPAEVYRPIDVRQTSLVPLGVKTDFAARDDAVRFEADPESPSGLSALPDVDVADELVQQRIALQTYKANLAVLAARDAMDKALLDISA